MVTEGLGLAGGAGSPSEGEVIVPPRPRSLPALVSVWASGTGTNLQALLDDTLDPSCPYRVTLVVSDREDAYALERARKFGVEKVVFLDPKAYASREAYDDALGDLVEREGIDLVCMAGFMRILGPKLIERLRWRILNIHPALLPSFRGARAVRDALAFGVKVTGTTVHFAVEEVDYGPIIAQASVPVLEDDTEETLHERIKEVEHRIYPEAVRLWVAGRLRIEGRRVRVLPG